MKIAFNPSTVAALTTPPNNKDITFDLRGRNIFARGVKFCGTDTWRDIKINNVSIGSNILDLRNGSNTTLTNTNGIVTINSTWRPVVDNLTSDSTTSSLSAKQGKILKSLIDGKSNSDHNHDGRYLRLNGSDTMQGNLYLHSHGTSYIGRGLGDKSGADFTEANIVIRSWWGISFKSYDDIVRTYIDTRTGNIGTKGVLNAVGAVIQGRVYNGGDDEGIIVKPSSNGYAGLILGTHNGERSVFYLTKGNPFWRYNNGSTNLDIQHPKKPGVIALTSDIPSSLKNPYSLTTFGVVYDGSSAKTVTTSTFVSQLSEGTSTVTDGTMLITSWASNSGFADTNAVNVPYKRKAIHLWEYIKAKTDSLYALTSHNHDGRYVRAFGTSNDNIDSDWGQSFKTFDPIPSGTPPEQNPNISILNIGNNFNRRKQLAFIYNNDNIYYRRHVDNSFTNWRRIAFANEIPTSLKNPYALTISLNGTSQGPYDGSAAKNINITPSSIGAAVSNHSHNYAANENYGGFTKSERLPISGFYQSYESESGGNAPWSGWMHLINCQHSNTGNNYALQIAASFSDNNTFKIRVTQNNVNNAWRDIIHSGNIGNQTVANAYHLRINSANTWSTWYWEGQSGQPSWLWGSNDGTNMYVWNPSNFRVAYASSAGNADTVDGYHISDESRQVYRNYYTVASPASAWILIKLPAWNANNEIVAIDGYGDNRQAHCVVHCGSRYQGLWGYQSEYNGIVVTKIRWKQVDSGKFAIVALISGGIINLSIKSTSSLEISKTTEDNAAFAISSSFFSSGGVFHGNVDWDNITGKPSSFTPSAHTHSWTSITDKLVDGNEFNIVNAGFNGEIYFNYLPINDRNGTATINRYHFKNGKKGYTLIEASGFIKNGSSSSYVLLGDGGHKAENALNVSNADTVDGEHASNFSYTHQSSFDFNTAKSGRIVTFDESNTKYGWINGFASTHNNYLTSIIFNTHRTSNWYVGYIEASNGVTKGLSAVKQLAFVDSNIASATKLQTPRTIWGQSFDGTGNVDNTLRIRQTTGNYCEGIRIQTADSTWATIILGATGDSGTNANAWSIHRKSDNNFAISRNSSDGTNGLVMTSVGMGLGTTAPAQRLDVHGNIRATGNSYATHFYESSDKTLKKNIKSILSSANIPKIREFDWEDTGEHSYGFIAQELEEQGYGCLVNEVNGKKTVNYTATLALTVAKLQNLINIQNKKISNLTKELKALKYGRKKNS